MRTESLDLRGAEVELVLELLLHSLLAGDGGMSWVVGLSLAGGRGGAGLGHHVHGGGLCGADVVIEWVALCVWGDLNDEVLFLVTPRNFFDPHSNQRLASLAHDRSTVDLQDLLLHTERPSLIEERELQRHTTGLYDVLLMVHQGHGQVNAVLFATLVLVPQRGRGLSDDEAMGDDEEGSGGGGFDGIRAQRKNLKKELFVFVSHGSGRDRESHRHGS
jgi:hypothetical protein